MTGTTHAKLLIIGNERIEKAIAVGDEDWLKATAIKMGIKRYKIFKHENSKINFLGVTLLF
jgi:hypothetical protein